MTDTLEYIGEQLKALTSIPSPTGFTRAVTDYVMKTLEEMGFAPERSTKGNVLVCLGGEGEPLVLASHVDTLGAMVRSIKDNGRLRPTTLGGHQWSTADGENCTVHTRDGRVYTGVVLNTEPSSHVADEKVETLEKNMEILLDENVDTKDDVAGLGIQTGDIIAMDPRTVITKSGYIKSRFLDDKLSASVLLGLARAVAAGEVKLARKVSLLFTVYEEVGHGGAFVPADTCEMISVDMGCVGDDLGCTEAHGFHLRQGFGWSLQLRAGERPCRYGQAAVPGLRDPCLSALWLRRRGDASRWLRYSPRAEVPGVYASHNYERSHMDGVRNTYELLRAYVGE